MAAGRGWQPASIICGGRGGGAGAAADSDGGGG